MPAQVYQERPARYEALLYDGTNAQAVLDWLTGLGADYAAGVRVTEQGALQWLSTAIHQWEAVPADLVALVRTVPAAPGLSWVSPTHLQDWYEAAAP
jgi:hypothetical protein